MILPVRQGASAMGVKMPRPLLILIVLLVIVVGALFALASLDHEQPQVRVERPLANETAK
jgi:CHASE1-domain containing sensor protein